MVVQGGVEGLVDQGALATATDPGDADERSQGQFEVHAFQVVAGGACQGELLSVALPSLGRDGNLLAAVQELGRHAALRRV